MVTDQSHDTLLPFAILLACVGAVAATIGWQLVVGFFFGVIFTLTATAFATADFE